MASKLKACFLVLVFVGAMRAMRRIWRVSLVNEPDHAAGPQLYAHWHGDEILLVPVFARRGYAVMASHSRDGSWMAQALTRLGYRVVRGSSSRGGAGGLKGLVDCVRQEGRSAAIAVDGPRGPLHSVKPGIVALAELTGLPIVPAAGAASRCWWLKRSWNQGFIPKPFSRCCVVFGEPLYVDSAGTQATRQKAQQELEKRLRALKEKATAEAAV